MTDPCPEIDGTDPDFRMFRAFLYAGILTYDDICPKDAFETDPIKGGKLLSSLSSL